MKEKKEIKIGLKTVIIVFIIIILVIISLGLGYYFMNNNNDNKEIEKFENTDILNKENKNLEAVIIDSNLIESEIKKAIIEKVAKDEATGIWGDESSVYAEGHDTLRTEIINNQVYAYITAEFGTYTLENGKHKMVSGQAGPLVLIFDIDSKGNYIFSKYEQPSDGEGWTKSLKEIFPSDLVDEASSVDYRIDFYQNQINEYLK